jgi:hypothetical protein
MLVKHYALTSLVNRVVAQFTETGIKISTPIRLLPAVGLPLPVPMLPNSPGPA